MKPEKCGDCERYFEDPQQGGFCTPLKDKYGWEHVDFDQEPGPNCPYGEIRSLNLPQQEYEALNDDWEADRKK